MAGKTKKRGPRRLTPSEAERLDRSLRLMAGRCLHYKGAYILPEALRNQLSVAHDALCRAFRGMDT